MKISKAPIAAAAMWLCGGLVFAQGPSREQILRPQSEPAVSILEADRVVRFVVRLPVGRETAFDAWTDANQLVEWFAHWAEMTVTEGEGFQIGWDGYDAVWQGKYLEVDRPGKLVFTWLPPAEIFPAGAYETVVTVTFDEDEEGGTVLTLEHAGFRGTDEMEAQLQAWRPYLFALRAFLLQPVAGQ